MVGRGRLVEICLIAKPGLRVGEAINACMHGASCIRVEIGDTQEEEADTEEVRAVASRLHIGCHGAQHGLLGDKTACRDMTGSRQCASSIALSFVSAEGKCAVKKELFSVEASLVIGKS
jgi:hypothetical protein